MYNIHSHYQNLYRVANSILTDTQLQYLHPFGTSNIENIEVLNDNTFGTDGGPVLLCYDQEPLLPGFNDVLFEHVRTHEGRNNRPVILLNTEKDSAAKNYFLEKYNFIDCYYFFHIFAAHDWYRGYRYWHELTPVPQRTIKKKFITFNRLTSSARVYRSLLLNELIKQDVVNDGYISYSNISPDDNVDYAIALTEAITRFNVPVSVADEAIVNITKLDLPLLIDSKGSTIPNGSMQLSAVPQSQESFMQLVTETCFWESKCHLTEKIFKPIISKQPFVLAGCAHNLAYLKSYGFKTFDSWFDESYDSIEDPIKRIEAIGRTVKEICSYSNTQLYVALQEMQSVLDHNYNLFYSQEFLDNAWNELKGNLTKAMLRSQLSI
jgi:hypothetical protein